MSKKEKKSADANNFHDALKISKQEIIHINEKLYSELSTDELDQLLEQSFTVGSCWAQTCPCKHLSPCECGGGREIYCDWYVSGGL